MSIRDTERSTVVKTTKRDKKKGFLGGTLLIKPRIPCHFDIYKIAVNQKVSKPERERRLTVMNECLWTAG